MSQSYIPLHAVFCTADLPTEALDAFVQRFAVGAAKDTPEDMRPEPCLMNDGTRSFLAYQEPTRTPVARFNSAYRGQSTAQLVAAFEHMTNQANGDTWDPHAAGLRTCCGFMVLDEQTARDGSCICASIEDGGQTLRAEPEMANQVFNAIELNQHSLRDGIFGEWSRNDTVLTQAEWDRAVQRDEEAASRPDPKEASNDE